MKIFTILITTLFTTQLFATNDFEEGYRVGKKECAANPLVSCRVVVEDFGRNYEIYGEDFSNGAALKELLSECNKQKNDYVKSKCLEMVRSEEYHCKPLK